VNETLRDDLIYLQRGLRAEGIQVTDVTADEAIKNAEATQSAARAEYNLIALGRASEIQR
jgi:hypothetical protein